MICLSWYVPGHRLVLRRPFACPSAADLSRCVEATLAALLAEPGAVGRKRVHLQGPCLRPLAGGRAVMTWASLLEDVPHDAARAGEIVAARAAALWAAAAGMLAGGVPAAG